jgi:hypothetical protein
MTLKMSGSASQNDKAELLQWWRLKSHLSRTRLALESLLAFSYLRRRVKKLIFRPVTQQIILGLLNWIPDPVTYAGTCMRTRVASRYLLKPKILTWDCHAMEGVGIFYDNLVHFTAIWYNLRYLIYILPVLVCCIKKNLATLHEDLAF